MKNKYTKEQINEAVQNSKSIADMCRYFGLKAKGSNYETIKRYMSLYEVDDSHFTGQRWNKGIKYLEKSSLHSLAEIMQKDTNFSSDLLKKRLIAEGIKEHKCERCDLTEWYGEPIPIELHHINGDHYDNRLENIIILCPNCHHQTDSFRKRKSVKDKKVEAERLKAHTHICTCVHCGKTFQAHKEQSYCSRKCYDDATINKVNISKEELEKGLKKYHTITDLAIYFKTSRTTLRKYLIKFDLKDKLDLSAQLHTKSVMQFDMDGSLIKIWPSMSSAEQALKIRGVDKCALGLRLSCGGFKWKYVETNG